MSDQSEQAVYHTISHFARESVDFSLAPDVREVHRVPGASFEACFHRHCRTMAPPQPKEPLIRKIAREQRCLLEL
ncbi:unnamed protein product [Trichogramma brassicae]|uniref:Uncharacterized protein n=1 Tax=Trichogramma brassicae TaxID=86971 RepID=A0A6H5IUK5_9HYME|nr:unnamed protein product [Trichogramma brassicae]